MWFIFSLIALLCWSGSDLFSKIGTAQKDKNSHWKVVFAVGFIMGIHFLITLIGGAFIEDPETVPKFVASLFYTDFTIRDFFVYLPVAAIYIAAMVFGYIGLRYIELSISSPICNCSGSLAFLLCALIWPDDAIKNPLAIIGVIAVSLGIISLGFVESHEDEELRAKRQEISNKKYSKSILALLLPVIYLVVDALGTVADEYLFSIEDEFGNGIITDYASNSAFELTFFLLAVVAFIILAVKRDLPSLFKNRAIFAGGACETLGQVFYMAVMFADYTIGMVIISAYCVLSVLWSAIFLRERLSIKHYLSVGITILGIILIGIVTGG